MRDVSDFIARNAAILVTLLTIGGYWHAATLRVGDLATFNGPLGSITLTSSSWVLGIFPALAICLYAIAEASAARTRNPVYQHPTLPVMTMLAFLIVIVGSTLLYDARHAPPSMLAALVSAASFVGIVGFFSLAWAASTALRHAEDLGPPPRWGNVISTFLAIMLVLPIGIWFIQPRINAVLARPRLS